MLWQIETKRFIMPFPDGFTSVVYGFYKTKPLVLQPGTTGLVYHRHIDIHWNAMKHRRNRLGEIGEAKGRYGSALEVIIYLCKVVVFLIQVQTKGSSMLNDPILLNDWH